MGLYRAGFDVTGVDIKPQPHYPFKFILGDAVTVDLDGYDAYWASPPCQGYSITKNIWNHKEHPLLIPVIRERLTATGKPFIIENVVGAPLDYSILLCGLMFQIKVLRHRLFETNFYAMQPGHPYHRNIEIGKNGFCCVVAHSAVKCNSNYQYPNKKDLWEDAMGIDWMTKYELTQAIPPAYSEFLGNQLMKYLESDITLHIPEVEKP